MSASSTYLDSVTSDRMAQSFSPEAISGQVVLRGRVRVGDRASAGSRVWVGFLVVWCAGLFFSTYCAAMLGCGYLTEQSRDFGKSYGARQLAADRATASAKASIQALASVDSVRNWAISMRYQPIDSDALAPRRTSP